MLSPHPCEPKCTNEEAKISKVSTQFNSFLGINDSCVCAGEVKGQQPSKISPQIKQIDSPSKQSKISSKMLNKHLDFKLDVPEFKVKSKAEFF